MTASIGSKAACSGELAVKDAEVLKKTLPGASTSFMQHKVSNKADQQKALAFLHGVHGSAHVDLLEVGLRGGKLGFSKLIKMIDNLIVLKKQQTDDDSTKSYCEVELDMAEQEFAELQEGTGHQGDEGLQALDASLEKGCAWVKRHFDSP